MPRRTTFRGKVKSAQSGRYVNQKSGATHPKMTVRETSSGGAVHKHRSQATLDRRRKTREHIERALEAADRLDTIRY